MAKSPHQKTLDAERLRRDVDDVQRGVPGEIDRWVPVGSIWMFADAAAVGSRWLLCDGAFVLRSRYFQLARVLTGTGNAARFELPAIAAPPGFVFRIWAGVE